MGLKPSILQRTMPPYPNQGAVVELASLRKMVVCTIALLLIYQVGVWIAAAFGGLWGGVSAIVVAAVSFVCARLGRKRAGNIAWFLVPTLLFTVLALLARVWNVFTDEQATWFDHFVAVTPFLIGFVIPIVLLLLVYTELRKRTLGG